MFFSGPSWCPSSSPHDSSCWVMAWHLLTSARPTCQNAIGLTAAASLQVQFRDAKRAELDRTTSSESSTEVSKCEDNLSGPFLDTVWEEIFHFSLVQQTMTVFGGLPPASNIRPRPSIGIGCMAACFHGCYLRQAVAISCSTSVEEPGRLFPAILPLFKSVFRNPTLSRRVGVEAHRQSSNGGVSPTTYLAQV